jgi:hypothetical protein
LLLFGGVSAMAAMVALLFVILAGEHKSDQPAEPSGPLTGAGSSAAEPDHDSGDLLEVRAAPVPTVPEALASDDLRRSEQRPPKALFEVREPDTDVRSEYAAHPSAGSQSVNVAMLPSVKANPLLAGRAAIPNRILRRDILIFPYLSVLAFLAYFGQQKPYQPLSRLRSTGALLAQSKQAVALIVS